METVTATDGLSPVDRLHLKKEVDLALRQLGFETFASWMVLTATIKGHAFNDEESLDEIHLLIRFDRQPEFEATYNGRMKIFYFQSFTTTPELIGLLMKNLLIRDFIASDKITEAKPTLRIG